MPSGKTHDKIAFLSLMPLCLIGIFLIKLTVIEALIFSSLALFGQLMFGPDLDINSKQYKRWGIFKWIWLPYMFLIPHRSRFSHGIILGPIFRCIYFTIMIIISFLIFGKFLNFLSNINVSEMLVDYILKIFNILQPEIILRFLKPVILGLFVGTAIHTLTDKINDFSKNLL